MNDRPAKRRRKSRFAPSPALPPPSPSATNSLPTIPTAPSAVSLPPNPAVATLRTHLSASASSSNPTPQPSKRRRTSRFAPVPGKPPISTTASTPSVPAPVPLDLSAIPVAPVSTIRLNRNIVQARKLDTVLNVSPADLVSTDPVENPYHHSALHAVRERRQRELSFHKPGEVAEKAHRRREQLAAEARNADYRQKLLRHANDDSELPVLPRPLSAGTKVVPQWEWWDLPFLKDEPLQALAKCKAGDEGILAEEVSMRIEVREDRITHYVHCPPPLEEEGEGKEPTVVPLMLTKKETKKLRRQRRMEKMKEKQEMIAAGLLPPEAPKVKLSNMMRVLATEASADPTKVEAEVRKQVEERRRKHEMDNQARKKTVEEKRDKEMAKLEKDREQGLMAAVFRIVSMRNPQHRFKVDISARQLKMTGVLVLFPNLNIVVIEGGAKALRKYKKLMLRRVDWSKNGENETEKVDGAKKETEMDGPIGHIENDQIKENACVMVWEGPIPKPAFGEFSIARPRNPRECKQIFRKQGVEHYWDLCLQGNPLGNESLGLREID
eukprot:GFKZ01013716.1.p1 GENE.GFKZ01013716.1~~GFKZ01013716.1.p1  ORF type:complete len:553 (-),score=97.33 GFKZ01013716.1:1646-3304(-)